MSDVGPRRSPRGRILYVVGPSGAGKDTLIAWARRALDGRGRTLFAHRYITRAPEPGGENHVHLTPGEMEQRRRLAALLFCWESHGHAYGVGIEVQHWLSAPANVVLNGSRRYLPEAMRRCPDLLPILIDAPEPVLRARLLARGRESRAEIEARLARAREPLPPLPRATPRIVNDGPVDAGGRALLALIEAAEGALPAPCGPDPDPSRP